MTVCQPDSKRRAFVVSIVGLSIALTVTDGFAGSAALAPPIPQEHSLPGKGPLKVLASNPRYFTDGTGQAIYLTGSHVWNNLQDWSDQASFDYAGYLNRLKTNNHNFFRLWAWEHSAVPASQGKWPDNPLPYQRTGPGNDRSGQPKFDLTKLNQEYFDRLRSRVQSAQDHEIYVSVMLFQGFSIEGKGDRLNPWPGHPYNVKNNVNGIEGDLDQDGEGKEVHTLKSAAVTTIQEAYVRKVIDTVNDLDNVLYEISNESHRDSQEWQYHLIRYIKRYEAGKPKQHPVGMTVEYPDGENAELADSPADWVSPNEWSVLGVQAKDYHYKISPPPADGRKVVLADTDHLWGFGGTPEWIWKSFARGYHPIFMDFDEPQFNRYMKSENREVWDATRRAMGQTLLFARRMPLATMTPSTKIASSGYCLTNGDTEFLVYLPVDYYGSLWRTWAGKVLRFVLQKEALAKMVTVDLSAVSGSLAIEWFNVGTGETTSGGTATGGGVRTFTAPFTGDSALYIAANK